MQVKFRLPHLTGVLLVAATPFAGAEPPLPDPIAPAVIGRPLNQIRPARPVRQKPAAAKPDRPKQVAGSNKAVPTLPAAPVAVAPAAVRSNLRSRSTWRNRRLIIVPIRARRWLTKWARARASPARRSARAPISTARTKRWCAGTTKRTLCPAGSENGRSANQSRHARRWRGSR
jgi:hypothetical protein